MVDCGCTDVIMTGECRQACHKQEDVSYRVSASHPKDATSQVSVKKTHESISLGLVPIALVAVPISGLTIVCDFAEAAAHVTNADGEPRCLE